MPGDRPTVLCLPRGFGRYPKPGSDSALAGTVEVDLGTWQVGGEERRVHLRIYGEALPRLVAAIAGRPNRAKCFGFGALDVFFPVVLGGGADG